MFNPDSPETNEDRPSHVDRRAFLTRTAVAAGLSVAAPFQALVDRSASSGVRAQGLGYGPLQPTNDETTGLPLLQASDRCRGPGRGGRTLPGNPPPMLPDLY